MNFERGTRVHIVGVGGAGMSSLAALLQGYGCIVSGCDAANAGILAELREFGVDVSDHHDARHVSEVDVVLWSPAVSRDHVELVAAQSAGGVMLARRQVLAELSTMMRVIGVTGTHGKTTATSMLVQIMAAAGRDDARLLGAPVRGVGFGGHYASGDLLAEVDESYGAFSELTPYALGLLNVEADHLDHYGSLENLEAAFADVLARTQGPVVVWTDDPGAARVAQLAARDIVSVGTQEWSSWRLEDEVVTRRGARARLVGPVDVEIDLAVTGRHNLANAALAATLALTVGVTPLSVTKGLRSFRGAPRRFEHVATWRGVDVVDDYAHLPGEIAATIEAAHAAGYRHVVAIFQPHRVTRTLLVGSKFAPAFDRADEVIITDIYSAGELNPDGITGEFLTNFVNDRGHSRAHYAPTLSGAARVLEQLATPADLVLVIGAGDVTRVLDYLSDTERRAAREEALAETPDPVPPEGEFLGTSHHVIYNAPLGARTTYRVGGSIAVLLTLSHDEDVEMFSSRLASSSRPIVAVGNGSNLLVADGYVDVVGVHLDGDFTALHVADVDGGVRVVAGAGLDLPVAARRLASEGVVGFEWAVGVPGTFGGAVAMNAGGHGSDMKSSVVRVQVWSRGQWRWIDAAAMDFSYRHSAVAAGDIVTRVELRLQRGDATHAREQISEIVRWRREHQPGGANAGSVFRNPDGDSAGRLIEDAGLKGYRRGTAMVSDKHANFIIADHLGLANDIVELMRHVRSTVGAESGVWLETEHRLLGFKEVW
ncbi:MAG: UDP-N-acetylmuramate--L-alanine ligase [Acidimicrobiaceae bacterium]|nr:UDP-N-acetylmuramate--L-alanine ligase [Acidimicrobiaceae bacterium]